MTNFYVRWACSTWFGLLHQQKYCHYWDQELNLLIDHHWQDAVMTSRCTIEFGETSVWIGNAFYAYGNEYGCAGARIDVRPSIKTMKRLDSLVRHVAEEAAKERLDSIRRSVEGGSK